MTNTQQTITTQYSSEEYIDDILNIFYVDNRSKIDFNLFKEIDEKSLHKESSVKFIEEIEQYKFDIVERFILVYLAISRLKKHTRTTRNDIIEKLVELNITKPSIAVRLTDNNSNLLRNHCIICKSRYAGELEFDIRDKLFDILFNISKEDKSEGYINEESKQNFILKPNELYNKLNKYVVGQDDAIKNISAAVYEHILKCKLNNNDNKDKLDKTNTLIIGPTGTGKTFICNTLSKILNIPIFIADAGQFTESGYVGLSPNSVLTGLAKKCKPENNKFPISIIYIDEIDKIAIRQKHGEDSVGTRPVQEELLKIIESFNYTSDGDKFGPKVEYDISNVMFILGGAFSGLEEIIKNRINKDTKTKIGFNTQEKPQSDSSNFLQQATSEDLIEYGFIPEFVGRLQNKVILNSLTKENLINILSTSQNNVISQYKQIFLEAGIELDILDETIGYIAEEAIKNNTGARGLKSTISNVLNRILCDVVSNEQKNFTLTPEIIEQF